MKKLENFSAGLSWECSRVLKKGYATKIAQTGGKNIVFIDGVRTPFLQANTDYNNIMAVDLARHSLV